MHAMFYIFTSFTSTGGRLLHCSNPIILHVWKHLLLAKEVVKMACSLRNFLNSSKSSVSVKHDTQGGWWTDKQTDIFIYFGYMYSVVK